jgi:hypothetical protein
VRAGYRIVQANDYRAASPSHGDELLKSRCLQIAVLLGAFSGISQAASGAAASSLKQALAAVPMPEGSEKGMMVIGAIAILAAVKKKFWSRSKP